MKCASRLVLLMIASLLWLHAQDFPLSAPSLKSTLGDIPTAPVPVGPDGKPIQPTPLTAEELAEQQRDQQLRQDQLRAQNEKQAAEQRQRDEMRESEQRAEQRESKNQRNTILYVVLAVVATIIVSRLFKTKTK